MNSNQIEIPQNLLVSQDGPSRTVQNAIAALAYLQRREAECANISSELDDEQRWGLNLLMGTTVAALRHAAEELDERETGAEILRARDPDQPAADAAIG